MTAVSLHNRAYTMVSCLGMEVISESRNLLIFYQVCLTPFPMTRDHSFSRGTVDLIWRLSNVSRSKLLYPDCDI